MTTSRVRYWSARSASNHIVLGPTALALKLAFAIAFLGCNRSDAPTSHNKASSDTAQTRIGLVLDRGGKDDKSFNASAYRGAIAGCELPSCKLIDVESPDQSAFEASLRSLAAKKMDLIVAVGFSQGEALKKVAPAFPQQKFAIVDAQVEGDNVVSLLFAEDELGYLAGAFAAMISKNGQLGFIGGMEIPLIKRFQTGYEAGARAVRADASIRSSYIGVTGAAWSNPNKARELASSQYASGVDVIFAPAGASSLGVFDAAAEKKAYAIGVDSNQNYIKPGVIASSALKQIDTAVETVVRESITGKFVPGVRRFDAISGGIDLAFDEHNQQFAKFKPKVDALKATVAEALAKSQEDQGATPSNSSSGLKK